MDTLGGFADSFGSHLIYFVFNTFLGGGASWTLQIAACLGVIFKTVFVDLAPFATTPVLCARYCKAFRAFSFSPTRVSPTRTQIRGGLIYQGYLRK